MADEAPLISVRYVLHLVRFMEARGVGQHALLDGTGVDAGVLNDPSASLCMNQIRQLIGRCQQLLTDDRAPFEFGQKLDLNSHGLLGFALLKRQNFRELTEMAIQHLRVALPILDVEFHYDSDVIAIRLRDLWVLDEIRPFMVKVYMGSIYTLTSLICRDFSFHFDFPARLDAAQWQALADDSEFHFGCEHNEVRMSLCGLRPEKGRPQLALPFVSESSRDQVEIGSVMKIMMQVRRQILNNPGREATLERVAEQLGMSPRSVRRHLGLAGVSFHDIRNEIREVFATRYLTDTRMPLERIAEHLGYSDQASFTKAYRIWTGKTPGSVRRESLRH